jgi:hypothetical protein
VNIALQWVNLSAAHVWVNYNIDMVISSACIKKTLPVGVQMILPACFWVNTAPEWVNLSATHVWVNYNIDRVIAPACIKKTLLAGVQMIFPTCFWVNTALEWVNYSMDGVISSVMDVWVILVMSP